MNVFDRENKTDPEFVTRFTERPDGIWFELQAPDGPGNVSLSSGPHKTLSEAQEAAAKIVREILRRRIQAAGIGRRGERPAFGGPAAAAFAHLVAPLQAPRRPYTPPTLTRLPMPCGPAMWAEGRKCCPDCSHPEIDPCPGCGHRAQALEDEQLCLCRHLDGVHEVLEGPCRALMQRGTPCPCDGFEPVAQVEGVESREVLS